jgi:hypothetical protein
MHDLHSVVGSKGRQTVSHDPDTLLADISWIDSLCCDVIADLRCRCMESKLYPFAASTIIMGRKSDHS